MVRNPIARVVSKMRSHVKESSIKRGEMSDCVECAGHGIIQKYPEELFEIGGINVCAACRGTGVKR